MYVIKQDLALVVADVWAWHGDVEKIPGTIREIEKSNHRFGRRTAACGALEARHLNVPPPPTEKHSNSSHHVLQDIYGIYFDAVEAHSEVVANFNTGRRCILRGTSPTVGPAYHVSHCHCLGKT